MPESVVPATDMYPSLDELISNVELPKPLIASLSHRYNKHGLEYASDSRHTDGRIINQCMQKDSRLDAQEELNDAIFNLLVIILKQEKGYQQKGVFQWKPRQALSFAIQAWEALSPLKASGTSS